MNTWLSLVSSSYLWTLPTCFAEGVMPTWTTMIARVMFSSCILWQYVFIVFIPTFSSSGKNTNIWSETKTPLQLVEIVVVNTYRFLILILSKIYAYTFSTHTLIIVYVFVCFNFFIKFPLYKVKCDLKYMYYFNNWNLLDQVEYKPLLIAFLWIIKFLTVTIIMFLKPCVIYATNSSGLGDHKLSHVWTPGNKPRQKWWEARAITTEPVAQLDFLSLFWFLPTVNLRNGLICTNKGDLC